MLLRNNKACSLNATLYYVAVWSPDKHNQRNRQATGMSGGLVGYYDVAFCLSAYIVVIAHSTALEEL